MGERISRRLALAAARSVRAAGPTLNNERPQFRVGITFFPSEASAHGSLDYERLFEIARFADQAEFSAIWIPERHFHPFGGASPNPSVLAAALATATSRIGLRGGSVVLPLHDPIRVAEEWALVDALSNGRAGIAFGSGWHASDFVLAPESYRDRHRITLEGVATVRALWQGRSITRRGGEGNNVELSVYPRPVQRELPVWLTASGNPETFRRAGDIGAGVLTSLIGQSLGELKQKIAGYRQARIAAGHNTDTGNVAVMLHTYVSSNVEAARQEAQAPLMGYLGSSMDLQRSAFLQGARKPYSSQSPTALDPLLHRAVARYFDDSAMIGSVDSCADFLERLREVGANEVACLVDFGMPFERILDGLTYLRQLKERISPDQHS